MSWSIWVRGCLATRMKVLSGFPDSEHPSGSARSSQLLPLVRRSPHCTKGLILLVLWHANSLVMSALYPTLLCFG